MKIQYKLFYLFLILILIGGFTNTISTSIILKKGLEQHLIDREKIGQEVLEKRIFPYVANKDYETVTGILFDEKEIKKESIYYIAVYDKNENILTHTFLNEIPEQVKHSVHTGGEDSYTRELSINNIPLIEIHTTVKEGDYEAGHLGVGYKKEYIERIESEIIGAIANIIIILSIISIILGFFLSKGIVKPVKALTRGVEEFGKGNLNYKIKVDSTDEIGQLATSFQKMTEELQRTTVSKQTLQSILESMPYGIILIGRDKKLLSANHAALGMMGYESEEQIAGQTCNKVLCPAEDDKCPIIDLHQEVDRSERVLVTKDGRRIPILKSVVPVKLDGRDVFLEAVVDISAQKQAMDELKTLGSAVEQSGDGVIITNKEAIIEYVNPAFEKLTGFSREEVIGKPPNMLKSGKHDKTFYKKLYETINSGRVFRSEIINRKKNGEFYCVSATIAPITDSKGNITHFVSTEKDITAYKKTEKIRMENLRLVDASRAKSEFLATMSHELRTPLNAIIGFSELLTTGKDLNQKQRRYADNILTSGKHLLSLINDILDLSKVEAGKIELVIDKMSVSEAINAGLTLIKEKAMKHDIALKVEVDPGLDFIDADTMRFKQILFNLLSNAVKFSKPEGGTVTITAEKEGDMAKFSVSDKGIGIQEDDMRRLFKEFEQVDSGISRKYGGTGLGLAITKKLVELHGGRITVESKFGEGSTFTFYLPIEAKKSKENT